MVFFLAFFLAARAFSRIARRLALIASFRAAFAARLVALVRAPARLAAVRFLFTGAAVDAAASNTNGAGGELAEEGEGTAPNARRMGAASSRTVPVYRDS